MQSIARRAPQDDGALFPNKRHGIRNTRARGAVAVDLVGVVGKADRRARDSMRGAEIKEGIAALTEKWPSRFK
jgi:hypothetical protein